MSTLVNCDRCGTRFSVIRYALRGVLCRDCRRALRQGEDR